VHDAPSANRQASVGETPNLAARRSDTDLASPIEPMVSFPKISSGLVSLVRQNHCIIRYAACDPAFARDIRRRHI
jgi:hypothetical protein